MKQLRHLSLEVSDKDVNAYKQAKITDFLDQEDGGKDVLSCHDYVNNNPKGDLSKK